MGNRPERVGEAIRDELSQLIAREVHDPGIGFITLTRVSVTPDLQIARVHYTSLGDDKAQHETAKALKRAAPFLRRLLGARIRLRRVPELTFHYDESIAHTDRIEQILQDIHAQEASQPREEAAREPADGAVPRADTGAATPDGEAGGAKSPGEANGADPRGKAGGGPRGKE